jgi:hypothetical protein
MPSLRRERRREAARTRSWYAFDVVIRVGLGDRLFVRDGEDGEFRAQPRCPAPREAPRLVGVADASMLPRVSPWTWEVAVVGPGGLGAAAATEPVEGDERRGLARFFRTEDAGRSWTELGPRLSPLSRLAARGGWPPERVEEAASQEGRLLAFAWTDPWLFDGAASHLLVSHDVGRSWRYRRIPGTVARLARARGEALRVFGVGEAWVETSSGLARHAVRVEDLENPCLVRDVVFASPDDARGLVVAFGAGDDAVASLVRTKDGGRTWCVERSFPASSRGAHLNDRHQVTLDVDD